MGHVLSKSPDHLPGFWIYAEQIRRDQIHSWYATSGPMEDQHSACWHLMALFIIVRNSSLSTRIIMHVHEWIRAGLHVGSDFQLYRRKEINRFYRGYACRKYCIRRRVYQVGRKMADGGLGCS